MVTGQAATVAQEYKVEAMYYMISKSDRYTSMI